MPNRGWGGIAIAAVFIAAVLCDQRPRWWW